MKICRYENIAIFIRLKKIILFSAVVYHQVGWGDPNQKSSCKHRDPPSQICCFWQIFKDLFQVVCSWKMSTCTWASRCQWPAVEIDKSRWDFQRCKPDRRRSLPLVKYHTVGICKIEDTNLGHNSKGNCKWLKSSLVQNIIGTPRPSDQNVEWHNGCDLSFFCVWSLPYSVKLSLKHLVPYSYYL